MLKSILVGISLAFVAAVQPGPSQAYILSRVAAVGCRRTLPAAFAPLISDGPIALLALLVLGQLSDPAQNLLRSAGALLLFYLAWQAFRSWRQPGSQSISHASNVPRTLLEAASINILNPNPYLGWTLVLGPLVVAAWREMPSHGVVLLFAFYATMVSTQVILILVCGTAQFLGRRFQRALPLISTVVLASIGLYQLLVAVQGWSRVR